MNVAAVANPFGLMLDPESIIRAIESSERLGGLSRRICRPLDKPLIPAASEAAAAAEDDGPPEADA